MHFRGPAADTLRKDPDPMTSPLIRQARPRDLPAILSMIRALAAHHGDRATATLETLQDAFFGPAAWAVAFVAEAPDGGLLGYAGANRLPSLHDPAPRVDIQHLWVAERHRAQGIGRALIAAAADHAARTGASAVGIGSHPSNPAAARAYRGMGLEEVTERGPRFVVPLPDPA